MTSEYDNGLGVLDNPSIYFCTIGFILLAFIIYASQQNQRSEEGTVTIQSRHVQNKRRRPEKNKNKNEARATIVGINNAAISNNSSNKQPGDPLSNWTRPPRDDCPICLLPLPLDEMLEIAETNYWSCCGTSVCNGCLDDNIQVVMKDLMSKPNWKNLVGTKEFKKSISSCPFCRDKADGIDPDCPGHLLKREMKLAEKGRHRAMWRVAGYHFNGEQGLKQDKDEGIRLFRLAAEAGSPGAAYALGNCYLNGDGVKQDVDRALTYYHKSADLGRIQAYVSIGNIMLLERNQMKEAMLNFRKAAMCGLKHEDVFQLLKIGFQRGYITTTEYASTLRKNQKVSSEMQSESRDAAKLKREIRASEEAQSGHNYRVF